MLDENAVNDAIAEYLVHKGFTIVRKSHTKQQGIDLIARNCQTGEALLVESKGGTSSFQGSNRYGKPYTQAQVFDRVAKGFYTAAALLSERQKSDLDHVALAIPKTEHFMRYAAKVQAVANQLGIRILLVDEDRTVSEL